MAYNLRTRLHFFIRFAGFSVFLFGIFILASAIKISDILTEELEWHPDGGHYGHNTCQYWAGIPTILTGLLLLAVRENNNKLKYIIFCCVAVTMALTLGVIIEEAEPGSLIHGFHKGDKSVCKTLEDISPESELKAWTNYCEKFKKANAWYYILLFTTDIVLVLSFLVILLLFADWILFIAPKMIHEGLHNLRPRLHLLIRLAGFLVFLFGIFILASAIKIRDIMSGELHLVHLLNVGYNTCQYWAGIPTILTGLLLLAVRESHHKLKYISFCCVAVTMVLTLGVIIEEAPTGARIHGYHKGDNAFCKFSASYSKGLRNDCEKFKIVDLWYYILFFPTDIVFVLCFLVILLLFADWFWFILPKMIHQGLHNLRPRLHFLIRLAGFLVFLFGIFILASAIKIRDILTGELEMFPAGHFGYNTCQYWAGIPTILTGLLLLAAVRENNDKLKNISFCCVAVTMVLTLGVIIEEAPTGAKIHSLYKSDNTFCKDQWIREHQNDCEKFKKADPWYYTLLFTTDIVLVLCLIAILLLFTDWILFIAPKMTPQVLDEVPEPNQGMQVAMPQNSAQVQDQMAWNSQNNGIPLVPLCN